MRREFDWGEVLLGLISINQDVHSAWLQIVVMVDQLRALGRQILLRWQLQWPFLLRLGFLDFY